MAVTWQGDFRALARVVQKLQVTDAELIMLNERLGQILTADVKQRFETGTDPSGRKWVPLAQSTLMARARKRAGRRVKTKSGALSKNKRIRGKKGRLFKKAAEVIGTGRPLRDNNILMNSINYKATPDGVAVGTNKVQAGLLNSGGRAGRGRKVKVPARPFIGLSADGGQDLIEAGQEWVEERVKR